MAESLATSPTKSGAIQPQEKERGDLAHLITNQEATNRI